MWRGREMCWWGMKLFVQGSEGGEVGGRWSITGAQVRVKF